VKTVIVVVTAALALGAACSKKDAGSNMGSGSGTGSGTGSGSVIEIPPYTPAADVSAPIKAAIAATDRTDKDRALDAGRKPGEVFQFFKLAPGQKVGELFSGPGYSTELMARVLGDTGKLYAQNTTDILDRFARKPLMERLAKPVMKNTTSVEQPTETPFPADAKDLDAVICILNYHDFVWQKVDRAKLNKAVFDALKPGGVFGVVDHSAAAGSGVRDVETLHRIDEDIEKQEILAAGFKLDGESDVLRNPDDKRDWNASPKAAAELKKRGTSDRFVLRFVKPS
jgi:predicted methyltransferase